MLPRQSAATLPGASRPWSPCWWVALEPPRRPTGGRAAAAAGASRQAAARPEGVRREAARQASGLGRPRRAAAAAGAPPGAPFACRATSARRIVGWTAFPLCCLHRRAEPTQSLTLASDLLFLTISGTQRDGPARQPTYVATFDAVAGGERRPTAVIADHHFAGQQVLAIFVPDRPLETIRVTHWTQFPTNARHHPARVFLRHQRQASAVFRPEGGSGNAMNRQSPSASGRPFCCARQTRP